MLNVTHHLRKKVNYKLNLALSISIEKIWLKSFKILRKSFVCYVIFYACLTCNRYWYTVTNKESKTSNCCLSNLDEISLSYSANNRPVLFDPRFDPQYFRMLS